MEKLRDIRKELKNAKIGVVFSCFDLLHPGHILMLEDAKNQCDLLVVGLQTDPSIDRPYKKKPILEYKERFIAISAVRYVDAVIKYTTEAQLEEILDNLKPDIRILGSDYKGKDFTGKDRDIEIYYHDRSCHNYSTSSIRQRVFEAESDQ